MVCLPRLLFCADQRVYYLLWVAGCWMHCSVDVGLSCPVQWMPVELLYCGDRAHVAFF